MYFKRNILVKLQSLKNMFLEPMDILIRTAILPWTTHPPESEHCSDFLIRTLSPGNVFLTVSNNFAFGLKTTFYNLVGCIFLAIF